MLSENNEQLSFQKIELGSWKVDTTNQDKVIVRFEYYAALMDAGNSWLDDEQVYLNFINFMPYTFESRDLPCEVVLDLPADYQIACGLSQKEKHTLHAGNYNILVDSPMMASASLREVNYEIDNKNYHLWFQGDMKRSNDELIHDFQRFTQKTLSIMGPLPADSYHFLFQVLPYKHYHGVEHWNSTVITIGPEDELDGRERYIDFLGVSCHELFHTWNVIRLRPAEMVPYEFQNTNLHLTGFITEGITTYYGDLILVRSGVYSFEEYVVELNKLLKKHYENDGRKNYSVAESSFDLWMDGYEKGIPGRKVSIYNEGALAALILDLMIRNKFDNQKSLDDVMRLMWDRHGKNMTGYHWPDYQNAAETVFEDSLQDYFQSILFGISAYGEWLLPLFEQFGLHCQPESPESSLEKDYGFRMEDQVLTAIASNSPAEQKMMLKDKIIESGNTDQGLKLNVERQGRSKTIYLTKDESEYFKIPQIDCKGCDMKNEKLRTWLEI